MLIDLSLLFIQQFDGGAIPVEVQREREYLGKLPFGPVTERAPETGNGFLTRAAGNDLIKCYDKVTRAARTCLPRLLSTCVAMFDRLPTN